MDIVDTFNHLIPTEHLDDALFLESNLENEVCEDFSTSQNVLEDSLKIMLSDKDPMLGSASAQFCLPVLDSTDPNFQMPCSTAVGLDEIMDEGAKEVAHSTGGEDVPSPNRNLRDQMDGTSVKSQRKSPRLMTQEPRRILRQSTLAKRSNVSPSVNAKKSAVKSGSAQKGGLKQDKGQTTEEVSNAAEHPKERQSDNEPCQREEATELSPSPNNSERVISSKSDEVKTDIEHIVPNQAEIVKTSTGLGNSPHLPGASFPIKEKESGTDVVESECGSVVHRLPVSAYVEANQVQDKNLVKNEENETMANEVTSEMFSEEKADYKTVEELNKTTMDNKTKETIIADMPLIATDYEKASAIQETLVIPSTSEDGNPECSSYLQPSGDTAHKTVLPDEKPSDNPKKTASENSLPLDSMELDQKGSESIKTTLSRTENNSEGGTIQNIPGQAAHQLVGEHKTPELQKAEQSNTSSKCVKNAKPKHNKLNQNKVTATQQKLASVSQAVHSKMPVLPEVRSQSSVSLKRHAEEQVNLQQFHKPFKVKKKHSDKDVKAQSCDSGEALKKKQPHVLGKNIPHVQIPCARNPTGQFPQAQKSSTEKGNGKSHGHHAGLKEISHVVPGAVQLKQGQLPQSNQKQLQKHHVPKMNHCIKEEGIKKDSTGVSVDHLKEDEREKLKLKKLEKGLPPRQRRSSRSLSVDEPPLFIPDNISTIKRESSEHTSPSENKCPWEPSKQCGFCRKPHGNRFMVGCGRCDDWFHGDCVGLSLFQAQQMGEEDKEYVCVKCCAEEDKKPDLDQNMQDAQGTLEATRESRTMECEKPGISKQTTTCPQDKTKQEDAVKHKVKIFKRESGDGRAISECKDSEMKKGLQNPIRKTGQPVIAPRRSSEEKHEKTNKDNLNVSCSSENTAKSGVQEKQDIKKKRMEKGGTATNVHPSTVPASKPSTDQIRQSVRQSLKEILEKRLAESTLKISEERAAKVATKIEKELFSFFRDTDSKYKNKYRSLIFNLKDPKNNILFKRVLKGEVTPDHLIKMSPEELASKELAAWRKRENRHTIEMIEKEQREVERRPITKITHKGEIEIESETPVKEQEAVVEIQESAPVKTVEKMEETEKDKEADESATPDTTSQHKNHLFDLNCKICIGRMAPPVDDLSGKKVKVSIGVARKPSDNEAESILDALSSTTNILASELLEEDKELTNSSLASTSTSRSETPGTVESETLFLAGLNFIWKGFINMPSVAKFVIKAYPISGSFESLTEDLPDSIQVGGRISPQTVWDYVEKIKASGTKEICVVRFTPVTEEDQISYTLLFAYFSSRKRYGVAANSMKQIKDLYIIPLGASDKIPHQLVPFDGPGIEVHRPNLLLGLIIRQKLKRSISAVSNVNSSPTEENPESGLVNLPPEKKSKLSKPETLHSEVEEKEEENDFFNSFTAVLHKQRLKSQLSHPEEVAASEPTTETIKLEPTKPLRFLPGVLVGWENQSSALELASKPLPVDDILQSLLGTLGTEHTEPVVDQSASEDISLLNTQTSVKEEKMDIPIVTTVVEETKVQQDDSKESGDNLIIPDTPETDVLCASGNIITLKGKPPDVSTEAFLAGLTVTPQSKETKETIENNLKVGDPDNVSQESKKTTDSPVSLLMGTGIGSNNAGLAAVDSESPNSSKSSPFINLKRDPRQAAGRGQHNQALENEGDSIRSEEIQNSQQQDTLEMEVDHQPSGNDQDLTQRDSQACKKIPASATTHADGVCASQLEDANQLCDEALMQSIETVHSVRRGLLPSSSPPSQFEPENSSHSEFSTKIPSPVASGSFSPIRTQQPNFPPMKRTPPGFQFQGTMAPNFPPQNVFGFPPHLPPPLLPPPGFGFAQNPLLPWPPVIHLSGQPPHFVGPVAPPLTPKQSRFSGPEPFCQSRDNRRPKRRHSDPWGRQSQQAERAVSRRRSDQHRQRFYNDSHHQKKGRYDWEPDSERNRHRDRNQDKERDRKSREEGHRDKERSRLSHNDKDSEGKSSRESRNPEKKDGSKSDERAHDKEREKSRDRHRERDRHHKDRDHSDRSKSKR